MPIEWLQNGRKEYGNEDEEEEARKGEEIEDVQEIEETGEPQVGHTIISGESDDNIQGRFGDIRQE